MAIRRDQMGRMANFTDEITHGKNTTRFFLSETRVINIVKAPLNLKNTQTRKSYTFIHKGVVRTSSPTSVDEITF